MSLGRQGFAPIICTILFVLGMSSRTDLDAVDAVSNLHEQTQQGFSLAGEEQDSMFASIYQGGEVLQNESSGRSLQDTETNGGFDADSHSNARRITDTGMIDSDVPPASIGRAWVDMSLGTASQSSNNGANLASNALASGSYSETKDAHGNWWQVQFDFRMKIMGVELYFDRNSGNYPDAVDISVNGRFCATLMVIQSYVRTFVPCSRPLYGSTVRIQPSKKDAVHLRIRQVRIEEEPTGREEVASEDVSSIICPFLSTLVHEKMLHGCTHTNETLLQVTIDAGLDRVRATEHVHENFLNNPSGRQDICNMEGALNEHLTSTGMNDCHTDFEAQGPCKQRHGDTPAECHPVTNPTSCGLPSSRVFQEFWAKLKAGSSGTFLSTAELEANAHLIDVVDGNPVGLGTILGSFRLLLSVFGVNGSIHKTNLERVLLQRKFPIGYKIPTPP